MVDSPTPPIKLTEYLDVLYNTETIQTLLREQVRLFAMLYLAKGTKMDKQKVWNLNNSNLRTLDNAVRHAVNSDIHFNALTIDFGA